MGGEVSTSRNTRENERRGANIKLDIDKNEDDHEVAAQRLLDVLRVGPPSERAAAPPTFSGGFDLDFGHVGSCTSVHPSRLGARG
jgi:hypothetical protein